MSKRAELRRAARAERKPARSIEHAKHGICRGCSRRRLVILPARLCEPCLLPHMLQAALVAEAAEKEADLDVDG